VNLPRRVACALLAAAAIGCSHTRDLGDLSLQRTDASARLHIIGEDGNALSAFESGYLSVPGLVIANDTLSLHPGRHRIGYVCPQPPDAVILNDAVPNLEFDFRKGRRYALRCVAGHPVIEEMGAD
jgi:hypothetical protein